MKHTKEPWSQGDIIKELIFSEDGNSVIAKCMKMDEFEDGNQEANTKRIVACVNACAGITNEALEAGYIKHLVEWDEVNHNCLDKLDSKFTPFEFKGIKILEETT